jgi:hypothetical protein
MLSCPRRLPSGTGWSEERRHELVKLGLDGPTWTTCEAFEDGRALLCRRLRAPLAIERGSSIRWGRGLGTSMGRRCTATTRSLRDLSDRSERLESTRSSIRR